MSLSNVRRVELGGGLALVIGDFTNTEGAASQTLAVGAGRVLLCQVNPQVTAEPADTRGDLYSVSTSNGITTITIYAQAGISSGTIVVLVDNGA